MTSVAGASRFYNSAVLANTRGQAPAATTGILGAGGSTVSLLDAGRISFGIGLSARARAQTSAFLNATKTGFNQVFSLSNGVEFGTNETLAQKIKAIRASLPESSLSSRIRGLEVDEEV